MYSTGRATAPRRALYSPRSLTHTRRMLTIRSFLAILLLARFTPGVSAQTPAPQEFKANSTLGELYQIGMTESTADKKIVITAEHLLLSVESARLALRFPNRDHVIFAGENEQLLLLSGVVKNPQKQTISVTHHYFAVLRVFGSVPGQSYHVEAILDAESLELFKATLPPEQSARYTMVGPASPAGSHSTV